MTRVIVEPAALDRAATSGALRLDGDDHHYLTRVLRLTIGDELEVIDGGGRRAVAAITAIDADTVSLELTGDLELAGPGAARGGPQITSVVALIKGERMDWAIAKLVELGVDRIVCARFERGVVQVSGDRADKRRARFERLAEAAARQCGRPRLPVIDPIADFDDALDAVAGAELKIALSPRSARSMREIAADSPPTLALMTGPEGGLTGGELERAARAGFVEARLGPRVLRAETAAIAALTAARVLWGDLA